MLFYCICRWTYFIHFTSTATAPAEIYTLSLHDALPICNGQQALDLIILDMLDGWFRRDGPRPPPVLIITREWADRKSTRLNSSHMSISYAVFCLKKKNSRFQAMSRSTPPLPISNTTCDI